MHQPSTDATAARPRAKLLRAGCAALAALAMTASATAAEADPPVQPSGVLAADDWTAAQGRGADQESNPAYQKAQEPHRESLEWIDPYRRSWSGTRGSTKTVRFPNRYGARLAGHLYRPALPWTDPLTTRAKSDRLPAIVLLPGLGNWDTDYTSMAQSLAESGYVVLSVEPQGQHLSEADPSPRDVYCDPDGSWRRPQEAGLQENGPCAGQDAPGAGEPAGDPHLQPVRGLLGGARAVTTGTPAEGAVRAAEAAAFLASVQTHFRRDPEGFRASLQPGYDRVRGRFAFTGIDAVTWLRSSDNPWRHLLDVERVGIAGHSAGAEGAVVAGNADRHARFRAAVAWDSFGLPPAGVTPTVPTMWQQSEQQTFVGPYLTTPGRRLWSSYAAADRWHAAGQPTAVVALQGSTHQEWLWAPDTARNPLLGASARGHQVALHYTLAWFDLWLKGHGSRVHTADASRRLTATAFDGSVDRTSIGQGGYEPVTGENIPYTLSGETASRHLSTIFDSPYRVGALRCDLAAGCSPT